MGFSDNLQFLRKRHDMTQEQLAEQLEVSRQSVSKWESGVSYPEMEKLLELCTVFTCSMDDLLRGNMERLDAEDIAGYDAHMNWFSKIIASGVAIILFGVFMQLFLESLPTPSSVSDIIVMIFVIPAVLLFVVGGMQHTRFKKQHPHIEPFYTASQIDHAERLFITRIAVGIGLILCGVLITSADEILPLPYGFSSDIYSAVLFIFLFVGVPCIVYSGIQKSKYNLVSYNADNLPNEQKSKSRLLAEKVCGVIMLLATALFLLLGFLFHMWHISWVVFPLGGLLCGAVSVALNKE